VYKKGISMTEDKTDLIRQYLLKVKTAIAGA
jgi:hypothetical protein